MARGAFALGVSYVVLLGLIILSESARVDRAKHDLEVQSRSDGCVEDTRAELRVMNFNIHNFYDKPGNAYYRKCCGHHKTHKKYQTADGIYEFIQCQKPHVLGLEEVAFDIPLSRPGGQYVKEDEFESKLKGEGYELFRCAALTVKEGVILWNYLAVASWLHPGSQWHSIISQAGKEQRCVVGAEIEYGGESFTVASVHLSYPENYHYEVPKLKAAMDEHSHGKGAIVFGDFNVRLSKIRPKMSGWSTTQSDYDPATGMQRNQLLDLMFYKGLSHLQAHKAHRMDETRKLSDHYAILQTFTSG